MNAMVEREQAKLIAFWTGTSAKIAKALEQAPLRRLYEGRGEAINLRYFHNRFGWRARGRLVCRSALYRTEAFMGVPDIKRIGSKATQTVHIEHTVPIKALMTHFLARTPASEEQTLAWLLAHSITTAATDGPGGERRTTVKPGMNHRTDALGGRHADHQRPFQRYDAASHSPIWDLVRGQVVNPARFTFAEHREKIMVALAWAG